MENSDTSYQYKELYTELEKYERNGICMLMDGNKASPMQIVTAHMLHEDGCYMRDYVMDTDGYIKSLTFVNINGNY